jgi:sialidase-1
MIRFAHATTGLCRLQRAALRHVSSHLVLVSFGRSQIQTLLSRSTDQGKTWSKPTKLDVASPYWFARSSPVRELPDGSLILGLYTEDVARKEAFGATIKSYDGGKTWKDLALIGEKAGIHLDAETDVISLKDGTLLAALRSSKVDMHFSLSNDMGRSWGPVKSSGFKGHCPYFLRHSSGVILLAHRLDPTQAIFYVSRAQAYRALGDEVEAARDEQEAQERRN